MTFSVIDLLVAAILVAGARTGLRRGVGTAVWPAARWTLIVIAGGLLAVPFGEAMTRALQIPPAASPSLAYLLIGCGIALALDMARQRFEAPLVTATPAGSIDRFLGLAAGLVGMMAAVLIVFALLHPWRIAEIDWNPQDMRSDQAIGALIRAVMGSVRRLILEESWSGNLSLQHAANLLLPVPGDS